MNFKRVLSGVGLSAMLLAGGNASAVELITNGGFETGTMAGWTVTDQAGGSGSYFIDTPGTTAPLSGNATSGAGGAAHGSFYAVTDQTGPGAHALVQAFAVPLGTTTVILSFDMFANDYSGGVGPVADPSGLDYTSGGTFAPNQHVRVDVLTAAAGAFDTGAGVVGSIIAPMIDAGVSPNPFTPYSFDISAIAVAGGSYQLRFGEVDNAGFLNNGVDNVSIAASPGQGVPEPATVALLGLGLLAAGFAGRRHTL